jgi:hypothetical protein
VEHEQGSLGASLQRALEARELGRRLRNPDAEPLPPGASRDTVVTSKGITITDHFAKLQRAREARKSRLNAKESNGDKMVPSRSGPSFP